MSSEHEQQILELSKSRRKHNLKIRYTSTQ
jgi:hypothetical protein